MIYIFSLSKTDSPVTHTRIHKGVNCQEWGKTPSLVMHTPGSLDSPISPTLGQFENLA